MVKYIEEIRNGKLYFFVQCVNVGFSRKIYDGTTFIFRFQENLL